MHSPSSATLSIKLPLFPSFHERIYFIFSRQKAGNRDWAVFFWIKWKYWTQVKTSEMFFRIFLIRITLAFLTAWNCRKTRCLNCVVMRTKISHYFCSVRQFELRNPDLNILGNSDPYIMNKEPQPCKQKARKGVGGGVINILPSSRSPPFLFDG